MSDARVALANDILEQVQRKFAGDTLPTKGSATVYADFAMVAAALEPPPVIVGLEGAKLAKKHFIELAAEMANEPPSEYVGVNKEGELISHPDFQTAKRMIQSPLTATRIRELRTNYIERTLKGNRSDLFGTDEERDELCRLALIALGTEP